MINIERVVNEYWMYDGEPFYFVRWQDQGKNYIAPLFDGVVVSHKTKSMKIILGDVYLIPSRKQCDVVNDLLG